MQCLICQKEISNTHFPQHLGKYHNISKENYKIQFNLQNFCSCGCGTEIKPTLKWAHGHHSRVNNISKREDIKELRRQQMKEWHDSGEWQAWNKGLTIDDERIKKQIEGLKIVLNTEEYKILYSQKMKKQWDEGKIVPQTKEKHWNWKGGTSSLVHRLRASHKLYGEWKYPILKRDNFSCQDCGLADGKLNVHHDKETMSEIMQKFVSKFDKPKTFDESSVIIDAIVEYHVKNNVSGVSLCKPCHKKRHVESKDND